MGNRLTKIYTKTGDDGTTGNADGSRIAKDDVLLHAIGDVDELNSHIGVLLALSMNQSTVHLLQQVQHHLFNVGGELSLLGGEFAQTLISETEISFLEKHIDQLNENLPALKEFILPAGAQPVAQCHVCRAVARRAERAVVSAANTHKLSTDLVKYLNRLSDLLFVLARVIARDNGDTEVLWQK